MRLFTEPPVLQSEANECGLACLAMVVAHHGSPIGLRELRSRFPAAARGMSLLDMMRLSEQVNILARAVRLEPAALHKLPLPAVLHWDMKHFVVLVAVKGGHAHIHDPARGRVRMHMAQVAEHFTGVAGVFEPTQSFQPSPQKSRLPLLGLFRDVTGLRAAVVQLVVAALTLQFAFVLTPLLSQLAIDEVVTSGEISVLAIIACAVGLVALLRVALSVAHGWGTTYLSARLGQHAARRLFRHLLRLPITFFESRHTGDIQSRFDALHQIQSAVSKSMVTMWIDAAVVVALGAAMLVYNVALFGVVVAGSVLYIGLRVCMHGRLRAASEEAAVHRATENNTLIETVAAIRMIKLSGKQIQRATIYDNVFVRRLNADIRTSWQMIVFNAVNTLIFGLVEATVLFIAMRAVASGSMTLGMLFAFEAYQAAFIHSASSLVDSAFQLRLSDVPLERVADIALSPAEPIQDGSFPTPLIRRQAASVRIVDGHFGYPGSPQLLRSVNVEIEPGEMVAITGPSGCGKSTLLKAICGLIDLDKGQIEIDGVAVNVASRRRFEGQIGVVLQDDVLLSGTIADNISGFDEHIDLTQVMAVAQLAGVSEDIEDMRMGYLSEVTDMGRTLSGGQRQRVLLARALYPKPRLLVLDEATASLDVARERDVLSRLRDIGCTVLMVAHRPDALRAAHRVHFLASEPTQSNSTLSSTHGPRVGEFGPPDRTANSDAP